jgi:lipoate-protein ligase B
MLTTRSPCRGDLHIGANRVFCQEQRQEREAYVATLDKVAVDITVVLGTTSMPIHQVLRLGRGAIIELDAAEDDEVHILANNLPVAKGMVVVQGNRIAVEVKELLPRAPDVRRYVATLEEWIIRTLAAFGVQGERREDRIGVWVRRPDKGDGFEDKIAAIGIRLKRWVSLHGIALNVAPDLTHYAGILACGVAEARYGVTSLHDLGVKASMADVDAALRREFEPLFGRVTESLPLIPA